MNQVEVFDRRLRLVGLQMSNHVPSRAREIGELSALRDSFLDVVLAEIARTGVIRRANRFRCLGLGRKDQAHFAGCAPRATLSLGDFDSRVGEPLGDIFRLGLVISRLDYRLAPDFLCGYSGDSVTA